MGAGSPQSRRPQQPGYLRRLPLPHLQGQRAPRHPRDQGPDRIEAVGAGERRLARLLQPDLRLQRGPLAVGYIGEVGEGQLERPSPRDRALPKADPARRGRGAPAFCARHLQGRSPSCRSRSPRTPVSPRRSPARSRPTRCRRRGPSRAPAPGPARQAARSPGEGSRPGGRPRARSCESPCGRGCRRPAHAAAAAAPSPRSAARNRPPPQRLDRQRAALPARARSHAARSSSASRRGLATPAAPRRIDLRPRSHRERCPRCWSAPLPSGG